MSYEKILLYYTRGWWPIEWVRKAVECGHITKEQFKKITNEEY